MADVDVCDVPRCPYCGSVDNLQVDDTLEAHGQVIEVMCCAMGHRQFYVVHGDNAQVYSCKKQEEAFRLCLEMQLLPKGR